MGDMVNDRLYGVDPRGRITTQESQQLVSYDDPDIRAEHELLTQINRARPRQHNVENVQRFAGLAVGLSSVLAQNVMSHPFIVLRRQCQVHNHSLRYHLQPFLLPQVIYNIQRNQSLGTLWKGIGSTFIVRGLCLASESVISEVTPFPREVTRHSSLKRLMQHVALKGISVALSTPFLAASLVETVQSEIASEKPGVLDCLTEGCYRMVGWNTAQSFHLLPVWKIVLPTVIYGLFHYTVTSLTQSSVLFTLRNDLDADDGDSRGDPPPQRSVDELYFPELIASFTGNLLSDILLYPIETVLHRLLLQGTRTIIDNTDTGLGVSPINTTYSGFFDCFRTIVLEEGVGGLYKGFGALVLQYCLHAAILKLARVILERIASTLGSATSTVTHAVTPAAIRQPSDATVM